MQLILNDQLASENITAREIENILKNLPHDETVTLLLMDGKVSSLRAVGNPTKGYTLTYTDLPCGDSMDSSNKGLRPITLKKVFVAFTRNQITWRREVGWEGTMQVRLTPDQQKQQWRRYAPVFIYLLIFAFGFAPMVLATRFAIDKLYFEPLCTEANPEVAVASYSRGSTATSGNYSQLIGNCIYEDYSLLPFSKAVGNEDTAKSMDRLFDFLVVVIPVLIVTLILIAMAYFVSWQREGRKKMAK